MNFRQPGGVKPKHAHISRLIDIANKTGVAIRKELVRRPVYLCDKAHATTSTRAAELLMARIREENQPEPQIIRVPPSLQIRSSCRAVE